MVIEFQGNCPNNVNRDAKYTVRMEDNKWVVGITYISESGERWYPVNGDHESLVKAVNSIKERINNTSGGPFYINEYKQVIVPAGNPVKYYLAGKYEKELNFEFEGYTLSGVPLSLNGEPLNPGDRWEGIHQGIPYVLKAGGKDIYYTKEIRKNVSQRISLSDFVGQENALIVARKVEKIIGFQGGRFYINEFRCLFTGMPYRYIGTLSEEEFDNCWFPMPQENKTILIE